MTERGNFGTKIGVVLATAGSAVGLGNIWRFPYMTGQDGGAAFILVYAVCILLLGIPGMVAEFVVGRHGASNAVRAYYKMGGRWWSAIGYMGTVTSMIILGFYAVIAGWCLQYLVASFMGNLHGDANYVATYFKTFSSAPWQPLLWTIVFIVITHLVVIRGVRKGIEKFSNALMPILFVLLLVIVVASCLLPNAGKGVEFLFKPDFSRMSQSVLLDALGQAFFSLSLGTSCLCTYASYFSRQTNLLETAGQIACVDTLIAILAGLMIFPAAFSVGIRPDSGPSLIFITLPNVFQQAFSPSLGYVVAILFYALLALAALTSTISMHEIGTSFLYEELHVSRRTGATIETVICSVIGIMCALSCGASDAFVFFGKSLLDCCDFFTAQILMPLGAFLTSILLGWIVPRRLVHREFTNSGTVSRHVWRIYLFAVRFVCPICIIAVFLHQAGVI